MRTFNIYTDGSSRTYGENTYGGWAFCAFVDGIKFTSRSGANYGATNQQMELRAALTALETITDYCAPTDKIIIYSDSAYLINCKNNKWYKNWQENGWINSKKQPVANQELWKALIPYFEKDYITWEKVKGHADNKYNNLVDYMAQNASYQLMFGE